MPEAKLWWSIGVTEATKAQAWLEINLSIDAVKLWQQLVSNADPEWVKQMIALNLDPNNARDRELIQKMRPSSAIFWLERGFQWSEIKAWLLAGFKAYGKAKRWRDAGFSPEEARQWLIDDLIIPERAREWSNLGLTAETFAGWYQVFAYPSLAQPWLEADFTHEDALAWKNLGIKEPLAATQLIEQGYTPQTWQLTQSPRERSEGSA